jgi:hypothetical protein
MISFITWTRSPSLYKGFFDSVKDFDCELIKIGQDFKSMASAYNEGTRQATGDILCYVHEDVRIVDSRFPKIVETALEDPLAGFAGPIGSTGYSPKFWWDAPHETWQGWVLNRDRNDATKEVIDLGRPYDGPASNLDGLMLCTKRKFKFPEEELPGIHFLDAWMCREAEAQGYVNRIFSAAIQHISWGEQDPSKCESNYDIFRKRWGKIK